MTGTNHALTGGVLGLAIGNPLAIPVAFVSHFVLDAMPHMDFENIEDRTSNRKLMLIGVSVDTVLVVSLFVAGAIYSVPWYVFASAIVAMSPDLIWFYRFIFEEKWGRLKPSPMTGFNKWHADIQSRVSLSGIWVEMAWFVVLVVIAANLV